MINHWQIMALDSTLFFNLSLISVASPRAKRWCCCQQSHHGGGLIWSSRWFSGTTAAAMKWLTAWLDLQPDWNGVVWVNGPNPASSAWHAVATPLHSWYVSSLIRWGCLNKKKACHVHVAHDRTGCPFTSTSQEHFHVESVGEIGSFKTDHRSTCGIADHSWVRFQTVSAGVVAIHEPLH